MIRTLFALLLVSTSSAAFACTECELEDPTVVQVVAPTIALTKAEGISFVTVLGTLKNTTTAKVQYITVEAKLTNAQGQVIDVLNRPLEDIVVPAGQEIAFRVQGRAASPPNAYVGVQARVTSAEKPAVKPARPVSNKEKDRPLWLELLSSWGPMILLILVWIVFMRKYSGKNSDQAKVVTAITEQNALLAKQLAAIESIAETVKASSVRPAP